MNRLTEWIQKHAVVVVFGLAFLAFGRSVFNEFVWDDTTCVIETSDLESVGKWADLFFSSFGSAAGERGGYYRPMTALSLGIDRVVWGLNPFFFHLSNVVLHGLVGILVYLLLIELGMVAVAAFGVASLFVVNPIHSSSVLFVSARGDALYSVFLLASLWMFERSFGGKKMKVMVLGREVVLSEKAQLGWALFGYGLAVLSKEIALAGAGLMGLLWLRRMVMEKLYVKKKWIDKYVMQLKAVLAGLVMAAVWIGFRFKYESLLGDYEFVGQDLRYMESVWVRMMTFGKIFWQYLGILVWPYPLHMERSSAIFEGLNGWWLGMVLVILGGFWLGWVEYKKKKTSWIWLGWSWFLIMLSPVSGVVSLNGLVYELWLYMPLVGFLVAVYGVIRWGYLDWGDRVGKKKWQKWGTVGLVAVAGVYLGLTWQQVGVWRDEMSLYTYTLERVPDSWRMKNNLAGLYRDRGEYERAIELAKEASELDGDNVYPYLTLASIYKEQGEKGLVAESLESVLEVSPNYLPAYEYLISYGLESEDYDLAQEYGEKFVEVESGYWKAYLLLGKVWFERGEEEEAVEWFEKGVSVAGADRGKALVLIRSLGVEME